MQYHAIHVIVGSVKYYHNDIQCISKKKLEMFGSKLFDSKFESFELQFDSKFELRFEQLESRDNDRMWLIFGVP